MGAGLNIGLARRRGARVLFGTHNAAWGDAAACTSRRQRALYVQELYAFRRADLVTCDSDTVRENLIHYFHLLPEKVVTVPIGIEDELLDGHTPDPDVRERYHPAGTKLILNVARLAPYKDQLTLVRAMAVIHQADPEARLVIAGPGGDSLYGRAVRAEVARLGLADVVQLAGQVPRAVLLQLFRLCDVFVLSSVTESQGLSLLEALASGCPAVASDLGPVRDVAPDDACIRVLPQAPERFAEAVLALLRDPARARRMGQAGAAHAARRYRWTAIAEKQATVYRNLVTGEPVPPVAANGTP
jgi:glycosyltransferase involved in cell wall biosynthesis